MNGAFNPLAYVSLMVKLIFGLAALVVLVMATALGIQWLFNAYRGANLEWWHIFLAIGVVLGLSYRNN